MCTSVGRSVGQVQPPFWKRSITDLGPARRGTTRARLQDRLLCWSVNPQADSRLLLRRECLNRERELPHLTGSTNLSGVGPVHAAELCGGVTAMWLRIR